MLCSFRMKADDQSLSLLHTSPADEWCSGDVMKCGEIFVTFAVHSETHVGVTITSFSNCTFIPQHARTPHCKYQYLLLLSLVTIVSGIPHGETAFVWPSPAAPYCSYSGHCWCPLTGVQSPVPAQILVQPHYQVFRCGWHSSGNHMWPWLDGGDSGDYEPIFHMLE